MRHVYGIHVQLSGLDPLVWRRLEVRTTVSFWELHCAIQDVMPWEDRHLHEFRFPAGDAGSAIGLPDPEMFVDVEILPSWETLLEDWFPTVPSACTYIYDFGDDWIHRITIERKMPASKGTRYPRCTGGEGRCPPEDVGGIPGFLGFREAMADPRHPDHSMYRGWIGAVWKPTPFDPASVKFSSPNQRLRRSGLA